MEKIETVIIGAGQAGLATSYYLQAGQREHLVLEKSNRPAHVWTDERWDTFTLVTPNWTVLMPGAEYDGNDPGGFMPRAALKEYFDRYEKTFSLPVRYGVCGSGVEQLPGGKGYRVETDQGLYQVENVVIATGLFQSPKIPPYAAEIPSSVFQIHSGQYHNPEALPPGAVLLTGSGQSGCQIAEELYQSGRKVYLCVGGANRVPRRYREKDIVEWLNLIGFFDRTADKLPSPRARFAGNPQASGKNGGHDINLHQFAHDGVQLLGRLNGADAGSLSFSPTLHASLEKIDMFEIDLLNRIDEYILNNGLVLQKESVPQLRYGYELEQLSQVDLKSAGINTVIWSSGYSFDFSMIRLPVTDSDGFPVQQRGVTQYPGLYFMGMPWLYKFKSGLLMGVGEDAQYVADKIMAGSKHPA